MKQIHFTVIAFLLSLHTIGQHIPIDKLIAIRTENPDTIQSFLTHFGYSLHSIKEPEKGKIATANMKYIFEENSISKHLNPYFVTVWTSPNLHEMYNSDNSIEVEFKNKNSYNLYRNEIIKNDFKLIKTVYKNNFIQNYYYKQTGNIKFDGEFIVFKLYSTQYSDKQKASMFVLEIVSSVKCPGCMRYLIEN